MISCDVDDSGTATELKLTGDAVMASAVVLHERLLAAVVAGRDVVVDVGGVERLDGAGLQILVALKNLVERGGASLSLRAPTDAVRSAIENGAAAALLLTP